MPLDLYAELSKCKTPTDINKQMYDILVNPETRSDNVEIDVYMLTEIVYAYTREILGPTLLKNIHEKSIYPLSFNMTLNDIDSLSDEDIEGRYKIVTAMIGSHRINLMLLFINYIKENSHQNTENEQKMYSLLYEIQVLTYELFLIHKYGKYMYDKEQLLKHKDDHIMMFTLLNDKNKSILMERICSNCATMNGRRYIYHNIAKNEDNIETSNQNDIILGIQDNTCEKCTPSRSTSFALFGENNEYMKSELCLICKNIKTCSDVNGDE